MSGPGSKRHGDRNIREEFVVGRRRGGDGVDAYQIGAKITDEDILAGRVRDYVMCVSLVLCWVGAWGGEREGLGLDCGDFGRGPDIVGSY